MNGSKKSPQRTPVPTLDLGLGDIIAPKATDVPPPATERAFPRAPRQAESVGGAVTTAAPPPVQTPSEYAVLGAQGDWGRLLSLTEERTSGGGQGDLAPRFWWVKASVALGSVPLSILAAPLETVTREIAESAKRGGAKVDSELLGSAADLLVEVSGQLAEKGELATALSFAERAFRLKGVTRAHLIRIISQILALPEPSARRDPAGARLRERCRKIGDEIGVAAPLEAKLAQLGEVVAASEFSAPRLETGITPSRSTDSSVRPLILLLVVAVVGAAGLRFLTEGSSHSGGEATFSLVAPEMRPELGAPAIERLSSLSQLDAIFYDFDRGGDRRAALPRDVSSTAVAPVAQRSGPKDIVDTKGPVETAEVLQALNTPRERPEDDVGAILFGAPKPRFPAVERGEPSPLPVERFSGDQEFVVITSTRVLTRPSFTGSAVAELRSGDRVRANGLVGDWLKIRSRNGQVGYILSQDVKAGGAR